MRTLIVINRKGIRVLYSKRHIRSELRSAVCVLLFFLLVLLAFLPEVAGNAKIAGFSKGRAVALLGISNSFIYTKCETLPQGIHYWYKTKNVYGKNMYIFLQDKYPKEYGFFFLIPEEGRLIDKNDSTYNILDSLKFPFQVAAKKIPNGKILLNYCSLENDSLPCFSHITLEKAEDNPISEIFFAYALKNIDAFIKCLDGLK